MSNTYYYACDECQQYVTAADKAENITCRYCSKPLTYQGFTDESLRYYQYIHEWNYHFPQNGFRYGCAWRNDFDISIPWIYNADTLVTDGFYIVAKIPHKFNPKNKRHFDQVKLVLTNMSTQGCGPDFRPDNVRFKENGDLVLIDFSENPAVRNADEGDFPALMKEFTGQFAACGESPKSLYNELRAGMSDDFRKKMDGALHAWEK